MALREAHRPQVASQSRKDYTIREFQRWRDGAKNGLRERVYKIYTEIVNYLVIPDSQVGEINQLHDITGSLPVYLLPNLRPICYLRSRLTPLPFRDSLGCGPWSLFMKRICKLFASLEVV